MTARPTENPAAQPAADRAVDFDAVWEVELTKIGERREQMVADQILTPEAHKDVVLEDDLGSSSLNSDVCGLAISGGGIRSATFGLGVLQGLAQVGLLNRFDYLSTVSGGGYIGSWLSAWIRDAGFAKVAEELKPNVKRNQPEDEPEPIRHLRYYSNYLAPRPGLFSFDGWTLLCIYLRNSGLNLLVLVLAVLGLFVGMRWIVELYAVFHRWEEYQSVIITAAFVLIALAVCGTIVSGRNKGSVDGRNPRTGSKYRRRFTLGVVAWLLAAIGASLALFLERNEKLFAITTEAGKQWPVLVSLLTVTMASIHIAIGWARQKCFRRALISGLAGSLGGVLLFGMMAILRNLGADFAVATWSTFSVPVILVALVLTNFLYLGLMADFYKEEEREWWSSHNARLLVSAAAWCGAFLISIYAPCLIALGVSQEDRLGRYLIGSLSGGWVASTLVGLWAGKSPDTVNARRGSIKEWLAIVAPYVFIIGLLAIVSFVAMYLMYWAYSLPGNGNGLLDYQPTDLLRHLNSAKGNWAGFALFGGSAAFFILSWWLGKVIGVNRFTLHELYLNRLVRCYLGATRERNSNPVTNFDPDDNLKMNILYPGRNATNATGAGQHGSTSGPQYRGPLHLINAALNLRAGDAYGRNERETLTLRDRKAVSFTFSPLYCGSDRTGYRESSEYRSGIDLGTAVTISGAAVSPNMGFHTSPAVTALLTVFNVRLGAWLRNPWYKDDPGTGHSRAEWWYLWWELFGRTNATSDYVYLSDGGHFENMGVYELIRRRCRFIVAVDSGADPAYLEENLGDLVRKVRIDFNVRIDLDVSLTKPDKDGRAKSHFAVGRIYYGEDPKQELRPHLGDPRFRYDNDEGIIVYLKAGLTGDEPSDLLNYHAQNTDFPNESTLDQFYSESQFEAYRELGVHTILKMFENVPFNGGRGPIVMLGAVNAGQGGQPPRDDFAGKLTKVTCCDIFKSLYDYHLAKPPHFGDSYIAQNDKYAALCDKLRKELLLSSLAQELYGEPPAGAAAEPDAAQTVAERLMILEMMTLLEDVFYGLSLECYWLHPINRGWHEVFRNWSGSATFKSHWERLQGEFSPPFRDFMKRFQT